MRHGSGAGVVASMALTCAFGVMLALAMATGADVYRRVEERTERSAAERIGLAYVAAKIHSADQSGGIRAGTFGGADAVYLLEELDGTPYETILYVYGGALRELFCEREWEPSPEAGQAVAEARELRVTEIAPGFLRLRYVGGDGRVSQSDIWMRSAGSAENGVDGNAESRATAESGVDESAESREATENGVDESAESRETAENGVDGSAESRETTENGVDGSAESREATENGVDGSAESRATAESGAMEQVRENAGGGEAE